MSVLQLGCRNWPRLTAVNYQTVKSKARLYKQITDIFKKMFDLGIIDVREGEIDRKEDTEDKYKCKQTDRRTE